MLNTGNVNVRELMGQKLILKLITLIIMGGIKALIEQHLCRVIYLRNITLIHLLLPACLTINISKDQYQVTLQMRVCPP
jgi:hypothetical protein